MLNYSIKKLPLTKDPKYLKVFKIFQNEKNIQSYALMTNFGSVPLYRFQKITSTMQIAHEWTKEKISTPAAFIANIQTQGVGQGTNLWVSPLNNLYLTILHQVQLEAIQYLSILVSCAIKLTLKQKSNLSVKFKWINDIFLQNKKLGGILLKTQIVNSKVLALIGIGINTGSAPIETATCIKQHTNQQTNLLELAAETINNILFYMNKRSKQEIIVQYSQNLMFLNETVRIMDATLKNILYEGIFEGVNKDGNAILRVEQDKQIIIRDGRMLKKQ